MTQPFKCCALPDWYRKLSGSLSTLVLSEYQKSGLLFQSYYISITQHSWMKKARNDEKYYKVFT